MEDACVDVGFKKIFFLIFCPCRTMLCIRKCCSDGEFFNSTKDECESSGNLMASGGNWRPKSVSKKNRNNHNNNQKKKFFEKTKRRNHVNNQKKKHYYYFRKL